MAINILLGGERVPGFDVVHVFGLACVCVCVCVSTTITHNMAHFRHREAIQRYIHVNGGCDVAHKWKHATMEKINYSFDGLE